MYKALVASSAIFILASCGGSSSSDDTSEDLPDVLVSEPDPAPTPDPEPAPDPAPVDSVFGEPLFPADISVVSCDGVDYLNLIAVNSDATSAAGFEVSNAIDNSLEPDGRWETQDSTAVLTIDLGYRHEVKEIGTAWYNGDSNITTFDVEVSEDNENYTVLLSSQTSSGETQFFDHYDVDDTAARFVRITSFGDNVSNTTSLLEAAVFGCPLDVAVAPIETQTVDLSQYNLDANASPGDNFDLLSWALDTPEEDPSDGNALRQSERDLADGYESNEYFYTADDGGMVFRSTIFGAKTSANTSFTRSELREMLRRGNTGISTQGVNMNNWVLGYQPATPRQVGGRGGNMKATLKVDHVTTSGSQSHTGRFIIGQIHAEDDEPIRLYYKKFPDNDRGYIYFAHELRGGDDLWFMVVGDEHPESDRDNQPIFTANPEQGIALGEIFSYEIDQTGSRIDVIIRRGDLNGPIIGHQYVDMVERGSNYDVVEEWNYFKAGAYSQNNTGEDDAENNGANSDFDQVTFYSLTNTHPENNLIEDDQPVTGNPGNQFAKIIDTLSSDTGELRYSLPSELAEGRLELRFTRTDDDVGNTDGFISLFNDANRNANSILDLRVRDDSFGIRYPDVDIDEDIAEVTPGSFQTVAITWAYPNGDTSSGQLPTITLQIDGEEAIEPFTPTGSDPVGGVATLSFRFGANSTQVSADAFFAIDDIKLYSDIAGTTLVFEDDFESYADGESLDPDENANSVYNGSTSEATVATE